MADELAFIKRELGTVYFHRISRDDRESLNQWVEDIHKTFPDLVLFSKSDDKDRHRQETERYRLLVRMIRTLLGDDSFCRRLHQRQEN
uniref:Uncharacterized protein n=1 Tax=Candidatus Kentrum sp. TUN TaxID=2126343 RepID=A0A451APE3_9GAMM|nr:MAG: hypothetical protein BECKTUN1418F_GA0071002_11637 [Candidatus Kentron sp. TUN]VFK67878.1 MAG: hypothetical protein BECKTUN1418E_GA0071001_11666 [Candidatus Kentron sp. TUN]